MRVALKGEAKKKFLAQFGPCVGVQVISMLIPILLSWFTGQVLDYEAIVDRMLVDPWGSIGPMLAYFLLALLISVFTAAISIEVSYFYLRVFRGEQVRAGDFVSGLLVDVGRKVGSQLWSMLFILLWTLLAMIPFFIFLGVALAGGMSFRALEWILWLTWALCAALATVKALSYSMMPYIIRDCPEISVRASLRGSITLMKGNKGKLFVLELSFLGWMLLSALTFGVLHLLYVGPYMAATIAGFYHTLKHGVLKGGAAGDAEFEQHDGI